MINNVMYISCKINKGLPVLLFKPTEDFQANRIARNCIREAFSGIILLPGTASTSRQIYV